MKKAATVSNDIKIVYLNNNYQALRYRMSTEDKRDSARFNCEAPVIIEADNNGDSYAGRMYNYSRGGMYVELDVPLRPETEIRIVVENNTHLPFEHPCRARVKWCDEIQGAVVLYNYGAGLQYEQANGSAKSNGILKVIQGGADQTKEEK